MNILLLNPAPDDVDDQVFWGDTFFGNSLARCLTAQGCNVHTRFWPNWEGDSAADYLLVLRGLRKAENLPTGFKARIVWIISHPNDVTDEELQQFEVVLCASESHTRELLARGHNAHCFYQCTDGEVFFPSARNPQSFENAFIFVGNQRAERHLIHEAIAAGLPLKIWGRGWTKHGYDRCVVDQSIPNAELGDLYRNSYGMLNDHWKDMSEFQYVNNRVFDALACGVPVISDEHEGLKGLGFGGVQIKPAQQSVAEVVDDFISNYDQLQAQAMEDSALIMENHTFTARASALLNLLRSN